MTNRHFDLDSLSAHLDGELAAPERALIDEHLKTCAQCDATSRRLRLASGSVASLGPLRMTTDEHRTLRQAIIAAPGARAPGGRGWGNRRWALAGALGLVVAVAFGVAILRPPASDRSTSILAEAAAPAGGPALILDSEQAIAPAVRNLPEVAAALNRSAPPQPLNGADGAPGAQDGFNGQAAPEGSAKVAPQDDQSAQSTAGDGGQTCLEKVAAGQSEPLAPVLVRRAVYRGRPAWLLVYTTAPGPAPGRIRAYLIDPQACAALTGPALEDAILARATLD